MDERVLARELEHHEELYSGFAQSHFAKPAVRALRERLVRRIRAACGLTATSRVLSIGCGIGDTELLLAPHVGEVTGIDISPKAIEQARHDATTAGVRNAHFLQAEVDDPRLTGPYDAIFGVFFLHHIPDPELVPMARRIKQLLRPGGAFWGLDPNYYRLSGAVGQMLIPKLMARYQTDDERELRPSQTLQVFRDAGMQASGRYFDFVSSPLAGLAPSWRSGYRAACALDSILTRIPALKHLGSNFEVVAVRPK